MICENCGIEHKVEYGSGRFCSKKCACAYSTKNKRKEINEKVSAALIGREGTNKGKKLGPRSPETIEKIRLAFTSERRQEAYEKTRRIREQRYIETLFEDLSLGQKKRRVTEEQNSSCLHCGISEWMGSPLILELDHIDGNNYNNDRENLRALCPNCHSQTDTWRKKKSALVDKSGKVACLRNKS